jgi:uncharacterized protein YdhG (YjbR/CyaY superfamily)
MNFEQKENFGKIMKKIFTYKIPETQLNELIHFQVQKFGTKINPKIINSYYDQNGNIVFPKKIKKI